MKEGLHHADVGHARHLDMRCIRHLGELTPEDRRICPAIWVALYVTEQVCSDSL